jgi:hypothetical protein
MATESSAPPATGAPPRPRGWPLFLLGVVVFLVGFAANFVQYFVLHHTGMPWPTLILTSAGAGIMILSVVRRFGILRAVGSLVFLTIAALFWVMVLVIGKTPTYTGPAQSGAQVPVFATKLADGKPFANTDVAAGDDTVFVFFRGFW